jgi:hypothetical protein
MASVITNLLGGGLLGGISNLINTIRGKSPEDAAKLADLAAKYRSELAEADKEMQLAQIQVNSVEAASSDRYTSRWRPTIGYVCGAAFTINFVVGPLATWVGHLLGKPVDFPALDMASMMPVLLGLLGLGGMRSWEKVQGKA